MCCAGGVHVPSAFLCGEARSYPQRQGYVLPSCIFDTSRRFTACSLVNLCRGCTGCWTEQIRIMKMRPRSIRTKPLHNQRGVTTARGNLCEARRAAELCSRRMGKVLASGTLRKSHLEGYLRAERLGPIGKDKCWWTCEAAILWCAADTC